MNLPLYALLDVALLLSELALVWQRPAARATGGTDPDRGSLRLLWITISVALTAGHFVALSGIGPRLGVQWPARGWLGAGVFLAGLALAGLGDPAPGSVFHRRRRGVGGSPGRG